MPGSLYAQFLAEQKSQSGSGSLYDQYLASKSETEKKSASDKIRERRKDVSATEDAASGFNLGLAKTGYGTAKGVAWLGDKLTGGKVNLGIRKYLDDSEKEAQEYYDPQGAAGTAGEIAGRIVGEGALTMVGGGAIGKGITKLGAPRTASEAAGLLGRASKIARPVARAIRAGKEGSFVQRVAANVIPFAPVDAVLGAGNAEEGERLKGAAENVALGAAGAGVIEGAGSIFHAARSALRSRAAREAAGEIAPTLRRKVAEAIDPTVTDELRGAHRDAETDALTGLANRRALDRALPAAEKDPNTAVIYFDANNFKSVNDVAGHGEGDELLKHIATSLRTAATNAGVGARVFRHGGDEFVVLAPKADAEAITRRATELFGDRIFTNKATGKSVNASISGNIGDTLEEADNGLQAVKNARKLAQMGGQIRTPAEATDVELASLEAGEPMVRSPHKTGPAFLHANEFVQHKNGGIDLGEIPEDVAAAAGIPAGPLRITKSQLARKFSDSSKQKLADLGYSNPSDLIDDVATNYNAIYEGHSGRFILAKQNGKTMGAVAELVEHPDGYWFVVEAGPKRERYLKGKKLLWESSAGDSSMPGTVDAGLPNRAPFQGQSETPEADISAAQQLPENVSEVLTPDKPGGGAGPNRAGFVDPKVLGQIAATGIGAATGAAVDDENRGRGALIGAAAGAGIGFAGMRALSKGHSPAGFRNTGDTDVDAVLGMLSKNAQNQAGPGFTSRVKGAYQSLIDDVYAAREFGRKVGRTEDVSNEASRARGYSAAAMQRLQSSFKPVLEAIKKSGSEENVLALATAERAIELEKNGLANKGVPLAEAHATVAKLGQIPEIRAAVDQLRGYYRSLLDHKLANGVISPEQYQAIIDKGEAYIPFVRDFAAERAGQNPGGKLFNKKTGVRRMTDQDASSQITDPLRQAINDTFETERTVAKQRVFNAVSNIVENNAPAAHPFIREVAANSAPREGRTIKAIVNGKQKTYEVVDDDLYQSLSSFGPDVQNVATKVLGGFKKSLQVGVTSSPAFGAANAIRDSFMTALAPGAIRTGRVLAGGAIGAGVGAATDSEDRVRGAVRGAAIGLSAGAMVPHLVRTLDAMNDILGPTAMGSLGGAVVGGVNDDEHWYRGAAIGAAVGAGVGRTALKAARPGNPAIYEEWLREGGAGTGFFPRSQKEAGKLLDQLRRDGVSMKDVFTPKRWWDGLQRVNQAIEEAPRLAYYKRLRAEGADVATASAKSRDVSLDFSTRGSDPLARAAGQTTAFWNPKLQGWDKMGRVLSSPKSWAIGATTMTAPSIALWNINKDNPEYWERPQYERNMFWLVPKKEGGFIRIPKPFEAGFVFASVPERLLDYSYQKDPERLKESMGDMLGNTFSGIIPLTTLGEPLIENVANFDFFRRRPVVPRSLEDLPSELQYDDRTSSVAVGAGHLTGISPKKIDNVIQDVTGSGGTMVSNAIDHAARASGLDTRDVSPSADQSQWARFATQPGVTSDAEQTFYRRWDAAEKAQRGAKALDEQGDEPALNRFLDKNADLFDDYDRLKSARKDLKDVSKKRKEVTERRDLSPAEKREMLADLADIAAEIAGEAVGGAPAKNVARR